MPYALYNITFYTKTYKAYKAYQGYDIYRSLNCNFQFQTRWTKAGLEKGRQSEKGEKRTQP